MPALVSMLLSTRHAIIMLKTLMRYVHAERCATILCCRCAAMALTIRPMSPRHIPVLMLTSPALRQRGAMPRPRQQRHRGAPMNP
jgi:hypothetical protein